MTAPTPILCPECSGPQMVGHPAGVLAFKHSNACTLRASEDATTVADDERARALGPQFVRQATTAERALLAAFPVPVPATLRVRVSYPTGGAAVRRRVFN